MIDGLSSGEVAAVWINPYGEHREARPSDFAEGRIDFEDAAPPEVGIVEESDLARGFSIVRIVGDALEINLLSLDRYAASSFSGPAAPSSDAARSPSRGGRPVKHDWNRATGQMMLRVRDYGMPANQAELVAELLDWFARNYTEPPDQRTVEKWVAAIWPEGPCDLEPPDARGETSYAGLRRA